MRETILAKNSLQVVCLGFLLPLLALHQAKESLAFSAWTQRHDLGVPIDQHLHKIGVRKLVQTCAVYIEPAVTKSGCLLR